MPGLRRCGFRLPCRREVSSLREPGQVCEAVRLQQWNARQPVASGGALNLRESSGSRSRSPETMSPAALGSRPGGTEAPFAYVFRALDLQNESTAAGVRAEHGFAMTRLPAFANWMAVVWRPRSPSLSPLGALSRPRGGGAVAQLSSRAKRSGTAERRPGTQERTARLLSAGLRHTLRWVPDRTR